MPLAILFHFLCAQHVSERTENKTTDVVIQQHSRKLLMMDILMSETCWAHKKWDKIASDIKLVFHSSTITMMHGPINISLQTCCCHSTCAVSLCSNDWTHMCCPKSWPYRTFNDVIYCLSLLSRGLSSLSAAARFLGLWFRIPQGAYLSVCCEYCVLSGRSLCVGLITRPEESYRVWCVVVRDLETSRMRRPWPALGRSLTKKTGNYVTNWLIPCN